MNIQINGETVRVTGVRNLQGEDAERLRDELLMAFRTRRDHVDVDLSQTRSVDSKGLGALLMAWLECGRVRLLNTPPIVRQFLDLTRQRPKFELAET